MPNLFGDDSGKYTCIECKYETSEREYKGVREIEANGGIYNDDFDSICPSCKAKDTIIEIP